MVRGQGLKAEAEAINFDSATASFSHKKIFWLSLMIHDS